MWQKEINVCSFTLLKSGGASLFTKILTGPVNILTGPVKILTGPVNILTGPVIFFQSTNAFVHWKLYFSELKKKTLKDVNEQMQILVFGEHLPVVNVLFFSLCHLQAFDQKYFKIY